MRVRRVLTTRAGGVSGAPYDSFNLGAGLGDDPGSVRANRHRLATGIGLTDDRMVWMDQVHGTDATVVRGPQAHAISSTDALVTGQPLLALVALTADCVPVLMADLQARIIAAVHAGRVGAAGGVVRSALDAMHGEGARIERVEALLGPAVCGACYEVPPQLQAATEDRLPGSACSTRAGTSGLDLRAGLWRQLADAGVARIGVDPRCTVEDDQLYSYRRDGTTGRLAAVIWLDPA